GDQALVGKAAYAQLHQAGEHRRVGRIPVQRRCGNHYRLGLFHRRRLDRAVNFLSRTFGGKDDTPRPGKRINLALQGGGAHGAFTWGVLDHLLEDGRLEIEGISGASAGAINAIMLADGLARGGEAEARKRLADFWRAASYDGGLPDLQRQVMDRLFSFMPLDGAPMRAWLDAMSNYFSPYDVNPLNINPLKDLVTRFVDFDAVRKNEN